MRQIFIASDHAGFDVKSIVCQFLTDNLKETVGSGFEIIDLGTNNSDRTDYTIYAHNLAKLVQNNHSSFGILICGSGIGVSMVANRYKNVRAALIYNEKIAELSRQHNNANVACFGARFFSANEINNMVKIFLTTQFLDGIHSSRVDNIDDKIDC